MEEVLFAVPRSHILSIGTEMSIAFPSEFQDGTRHSSIKENGRFGRISNIYDVKEGKLHWIYLAQGAENYPHRWLNCSRHYVAARFIIFNTTHHNVSYTLEIFILEKCWPRQDSRGKVA